MESSFKMKSSCEKKIRNTHESKHKNSISFAIHIIIISILFTQGTNSIKSSERISFSKVYSILFRQEIDLSGKEIADKFLCFCLFYFSKRTRLTL